MPQLADPADCSGCGACVSRCPTGALAMEMDATGFLSPRIRKDACVECGSCEKACPILHPFPLPRYSSPTVYAGWSTDPLLRLESSSGGLFTCLAESILEIGGVVFAVRWEDGFLARFAKAEKSGDLEKFRSSKYLQAETRSIYREVEEELGRGRPVFFIGTPCQVAGLYSFLGRMDENLFTVDILCHGVPSPTLFRKWIKFLEGRFHDSLLSIQMRGKRKSWSKPTITLTMAKSPDRPIHFLWSDKDAVYFKMFHKNLSLRPSCSRCPFARIPRVGDVTLGDFWKIGSRKPFPEETKDGVSLILINSERGEKLQRLAEGKMITFPRDLDEALDGNPLLKRPSIPHPKRDLFLIDSVQLTFPELVRKYRTDLFGTFSQRLKMSVKTGIAEWGARLFGESFLRSIRRRFLKKGK